jgi:hypothetical protein
MTRENRYPEGWDEERVRQLLTHDEEQSAEEAVAVDEAGSQVVVQARSQRGGYGPY